MSDDFKGNRYVTIEPGDENVPLRAKFNPCTASTANDGSIPYGSTLASCVAYAHFHDDTGFDASTSLIPATVNVTSQVAIAYLSYSTALVAGLYDVTWMPSVSLTGSTRIMTRQFDYDRVYVGNR